ncbi:hypothetical protein LguiA_019280 [Lonicera macranthoides]
MLKTTEGIIIQYEVVGLSRFSLPVPNEYRDLALEESGNGRQSCGIFFWIRTDTYRISGPFGIYEFLNAYIAPSPGRRLGQSSSHQSAPSNAKNSTNLLSGLSVSAQRPSSSPFLTSKPESANAEKSRKKAPERDSFETKHVIEKSHTSSCVGFKEEVEEKEQRKWNLRPRKPQRNTICSNRGSCKINGATLQDNRYPLPPVSSGSGSRMSRNPKKRPKAVQKQRDNLFPGTSLALVTPDAYKVHDASQRLVNSKFCEVISSFFKWMVASFSNILKRKCNNFIWESMELECSAEGDLMGPCLVQGTQKEMRI